MAHSGGRQHHNNGSTYPRHPLGKRSHAFTLNLKRRHLNREQRRELIAESLKSDPQLSNREHERRTGAGRDLVGVVRKEMESDGRLSDSDSRISADGRERPVSQPKRKPQPQPEPAPGITSEEVDELNQLPTEQPTRHITATAHPGAPPGVFCFDSL